MSLKKINEIFGYGLFLIGALKILLVILVLIQVGTNIISIFNGGNYNSDYYSILSIIIGFAQIFLAIGSIIMIILNKKKHSEVIPGYLLGLGALLVELITPSIISFYVLFVECSMYMKAGAKIREKNVWSDKSYRKIKQDIKNTEWFYSDKKEEYDISSPKYSEEIKEVEILYDVNGKDQKLYIKENFTTILLIAIIVIILLIFVFFIIRIKSDHNKIVNNSNIKQGSVEFKNTIVKELEFSENTTNQINITNNKDIINIQSGNAVLNQLSEKFNSAKFAEGMRVRGYTMNSKVVENKVIISSAGKGINFNVEVLLNDNILYTKILYDSKNPEITFVKVIIASLFMDCVGQIKGYSEGHVFNALTGENYINYTLENNGIEIKNIGSNYDIVIKVDLNSDFLF